MLVVFERLKLHEEVWTISMKDIANTYGAPEASLRKYCTNLEVSAPYSRGLKKCIKVKCYYILHLDFYYKYISKK